MWLDLGVTPHACARIFDIHDSPWRRNDAHRTVTSVIGGNGRICQVHEGVVRSRRSHTISTIDWPLSLWVRAGEIDRHVVTPDRNPNPNFCRLGCNTVIISGVSL